MSDAQRLVHSEGDGLSGLVVDRFGDTLVLEFFSAGMHRFRQTIQDVLERHYPGSRYYWFAEEHVQKQESFDCRPPEPPLAGVITEHGVRFRVAPGSKHKTGFFLDQRDNRKALAEFCKGRRVLDLCCNTGGFAVYAKVRGEAEDVVGVDLDEQAITLAKQNANLNQARIRFVQADLFPWLRETVANGTRFDVVVLDPSKQTRDREEIDFALKRYFDMNKLALHAVAPGGIYSDLLLHRLDRRRDVPGDLTSGGLASGAELASAAGLGAGADHPFLVHVPEGRYLKAVFCRVQ